MMKWGPQQDAALKDVAKWLKDPSRQVYRLFGFAGTGKTTLAKHLAQDVTGGVAYAAFTGKAAYVLREAGCSGATTIHQLIYVPAQKSRERLLQLQKKLAELKTAEKVDRKAIARVERELDHERSNVARPFFKINFESPLCQKELLVLDECSMVDEQIGSDLLSFGKKILVLGDPAQLPPVFGAGFFTDAEPDTMLTEIHRQAKDNPIIEMSRRVREEGRLDPGYYGGSEVATLDVIRSRLKDQVLASDQLLVGRNKTRRIWNNRVREILERDSLYPMEGDRLVCLRNNHELGLLNGSIWLTKESMLDPDDPDALLLTLDPDTPGDKVRCLAHAQEFRGEKIDHYEIGSRNWFDFGYTLTVHKSQGSQWDKVLLFSDWNRDGYRRWLYTGITRAAEEVTVVLP